jgi:RNA polymerase sigma-70 factor (ECF subfamily)
VAVVVQADPERIGVLPIDRDLEGVDDLSREPDLAGPAERVACFRACLATEDAFRRFYDAALPRVYGYLLHRCRGDAALAEDLTQTTFGEAVRRRGTYDGRSDAVTWLIGIARHKLLDQFRSDERDERRRMHLVVRELVLDREGVEWRDVDERAVLLAALGRLTSMQRAVLILHYADGLPVAEIAREIGRSEAATESLMTRARAALRAAYEEASDD